MEAPAYDLPDAAIAQHPVEPRDASRLLDATAGAVVHRHVRDLPDLLSPGDVLVVDTSRVIPARFNLAKITGGHAEVLLLSPTGPDGRTWAALVKPGRRLPPGTILVDGGERPVLTVGETASDGQRLVRFADDAALAGLGTVALPPYIHEPLSDPDRYQTVYADRPGSVAAPTAGLHLTNAVLDRCRSRGVVVAHVDLAIGLATFRPVTVDRVEDHVMHVERYHVPEGTWEACARARRVIAVGTTSVRALETAARTGRLDGDSDLFIKGDFSFAVTDLLLTNFHMPRSTLLLLLEAFCGPIWRDLYSDALAHGYRFLSFGDAMLVDRR